MNNIAHFFSELYLESFFRAVLLLVVGYYLGKLLSASVKKALGKRLAVLHITLLTRIIFYTIFLLFLASAIQQLGFRITALLGATGILTVAIGIAAQTSMSNLISGIFIVGEKPFEIGNTIMVNDLKGEVLSIDFVSVKIRTVENTMIRIPNETLIKSAIKNLSYFPFRRVDIKIGLSYSEDIEKIEKILLEIVKSHPLYLDEPAPSVSADSLTDYGWNVLLSVWVKQKNYNSAKNFLQAKIITALRENKIELPSQSPLSLDKPFPVKIIDNNEQE